MKLKALLFAAGIALAACSPTPAPEPVVPIAGAPDKATMTITDSACTARGGHMQQVGRMQSWQCVVKYADAGKQCSDGDDCLGDCRASDEKRPDPGTAATGQCSADSSRFGCHTTIEGGAVANTLCVD